MCLFQYTSMYAIQQTTIIFFLSNNCGLEDEERTGLPKIIEDEKLEALLNKDFCRTQEELAESLESQKQLFQQVKRQSDTSKSWKFDVILIIAEGH